MQISLIHHLIIHKKHTPPRRPVQALHMPIRVHFAGRQAHIHSRAGDGCPVWLARGCGLIRVLYERARRSCEDLDVGFLSVVQVRENARYRARGAVYAAVDAE